MDNHFAGFIHHTRIPWDDPRSKFFRVKVLDLRLPLLAADYFQPWQLIAIYCPTQIKIPQITQVSRCYAIFFWGGDIVTGITIFQWEAYSESLEAESPSARNPRLFVVHGSGEAKGEGWINGAQGLMFRKPQNHQVLLEVSFKDCRLSWLRKWDDELGS